MNKNELILNQISKHFPLPSGEGNLAVLDQVSLQVARGDIIAILGPSGCGKSTLLNIVAGFEKPDEGQAIFMGSPITQPSPKRGVVFQSSVLFPWLTVKENIAYGLKVAGQKSDIIENKIIQFTKLVGLKGFENYYPNQLSGGMQQRAAIARTLILEPRLLLMDEPFASLDAQTRASMQQLLLSISEKLHPTILFVTHDAEEALILADKIYVMSRLPSQIIQEIQVPFRRPRPVSIIGSIEFSKIKSDILEQLIPPI